MPSRSGEPDATRFRGSHVFPAQGKYYFNTREGVDVGPFDTRADAELNSTRLRLILASITDPALADTVVRRYTEIPLVHRRDLRALVVYVAKHMRVERQTTR
jgi:hypothetical protein